MRPATGRILLPSVPTHFMPEKRKSAVAFSCRAFYLCRRDDSPCTLWLAKALEMDNLALAQEADHIIDVRIVGQTEDVVISEAGFLLWCDLARTTFVGLSDVTATEHILQGQGMFPNVSAHMRE